MAPGGPAARRPSPMSARPCLPRPNRHQAHPGLARPQSGGAREATAARPGCGLHRRRWRAGDAEVKWSILDAGTRGTALSEEMPRANRSSAIDVAHRAGHVGGSFEVGKVAAAVEHGDRRVR